MKERSDESLRNNRKIKPTTRGDEDKDDEEEYVNDDRGHNDFFTNDKIYSPRRFSTKSKMKRRRIILGYIMVVTLIVEGAM
jgi:hypothetical protein